LSDAKKTGSRDISELKQRLGLKKGAAAAQAGSASRANGAPSGGVVAPPGLNLPPPPGMAPAQPAIPNAHDDPFGAMNAMAAVATVQRAPEMVIVHDGNPVEHVGQKSSAATLLRILVPALVALIVGVAVGKIGSSASSYNDGIQGAKAILGNKDTASTVVSLKKALSDLDTLLDDASKKGFKPDIAVDKQLKELATRLEVKQEMQRVLHQAEHQITDPEVVGQLLSFYAGINEVKSMIDGHNKAALGDDIALKKGAATGEAAPKYGVLLSAPSESDASQFGAKVVELAGVYCGTGNSPQPHCGDNEPPAAYAYRNDPGATPIKGDLVDRGSDTLPAKKIVPLLQNGIADAFIKGNDSTVSEFYYQRRLKTLYELVHGKNGPDGKPQGGLLDDGNKLETKLQTETSKGTKFSFFM
jgi:hypothetical protein